MARTRVWLGICTFLVCALLAALIVVSILLANRSAQTVSEAPATAPSAATAAAATTNTANMHTSSLFFDGILFSTSGHDDDDDGNDQPPGGTLTIDYAIVGQGAGGLATGYWLSQALRNSGVPKSQVSVAAFEASSKVGGNIRAVKLQKPPNYDGSFGADLFGDMGAQRTTQMSLGMKRRLIKQLNITMFMTPFKNDIHLRGRRKVCNDPTDQALQALADYIADGGDPTTSTGVGDLAFKYGDLCTYHDEFIDPECGAYIGLRPVADPTGNDDPSLNAYEYLLHNGEFKVAADEPDINTGSYDFYTSEGFNPLTGVQCAEGTTCPFDVASSKYDWKTHVAKYLAHADGRLNYNYSEFMEGDDVGFLGDYRKHYGARSYGDYQLREWANTNGVNGYLPGGERRIAQALLKKETDNGVQVFLNERVVSIVTGTGSNKYVLKTSKNRVVNVRKFLFLNLPPYYLFEKNDIDPAVGWAGAELSGDVVNSLRNVPQLKHPDPQTVVRILAQWEPGKPAWFWQFLDNLNGNHSYRQYGDTGCFSRTEFIDTPYHRCTNHIVPVYTDDKCKEIWLGYLEEAQRTGNFVLLKQRVVDEMRASFPGVVHIPTPVMVAIDYFPSAWHWGKRT